MTKKIWTGFVTVFVMTQLFEGLISFFLLDPIYISFSQIWRPLAEMKLWMLPVIGAFFSFFFVYIFSKGYEGKGILEGVRYGFYVALMTALPHAYGNYALMQIPYTLALQWFTYTTIEYVIAGAILSGVFGLQTTTSTSS